MYKTKDFIKNNWKYILVSTLLLVVVALTVNWVVLQRVEYGVFDTAGFYRGAMLFCAMVWVVFAVALWILLNKSVKLEYIFLFFYVIFGIGYLTTLPFSTIPDEEAHFVRIYGITEGHFLAEVNEKHIGGAYVADNILEEWDCSATSLADVKGWYDREEGETSTFYEAANTALYSPLSYLPQSIGMGIARLVSDNVVFMLYMTRIVSWLVVGAMLFFAIRIIPFGKMLLMLISLLPMNMQECAAFAADGWTYGVVSLFVAYVLYLRYSSDKAMNVKQYILLYVLLILLASCKIVYVPLCLLAFFIPMECFGGKKNYIKNAILAAVTVLIFTVGWLIISSGYLIEFNPGVDSASQVQYILHNPFEYLKVIISTVMVQIKFYIRTLFGWRLGHLSVVINDVMVYTSIIVFLCVAVREKVKLDDKAYNKFRLGLLGITGIVILIMFTSLFVQWTPVGAANIKGVQGRYFLPLLYIAIIGLKKSVAKDESEEKENRRGFTYEMLALGYIHVNALVSLYTHYVV